MLQSQSQVTIDINEMTANDVLQDRQNTFQIHTFFLQKTVCDRLSRKDSRNRVFRLKTICEWSRKFLRDNEVSKNCPNLELLESHEFSLKSTEHIKL